METSGELRYEIEDLARLSVKINEETIAFRCYILPTMINYQSVYNRKSPILEDVPLHFHQQFFEQSIGERLIEIDRVKEDFEIDDHIFIKIPFSFMKITKNLIFKVNRTDDEGVDESINLKRSNLVLQKQVKLLENKVSNLNEEVKGLHGHMERINKQLSNRHYYVDSFIFDVDDFHRFLQSSFPDYKQTCELKTDYGTFDEMNWLMGVSMNGNKINRALYPERPFFNGLKKVSSHYKGRFVDLSKKTVKMFVKSEEKDIFLTYNDIRNFLCKTNDKHQLVRTYLSLKGYNCDEDDIGPRENEGHPFFYKDSFNMSFRISKTTWNLDESKFTFGQSTSTGREVLNFEPW